MGYIVTFVNTPLNISKPLNPSSFSSNSIKFVEIPFKSSDHQGLPPNSENSDSVQYNLLEASFSLKLPFKNLLNDLTRRHEKPICVISDLFFGWAAEVAHEFDIFTAIFSPAAGAFGMACDYSMWLNLPHKQTDEVEFQLPDFPEAGEFHVTQLTQAVLTAGEDDPLTKFQRRNFSSWLNSDAILFNTVEEMDQTGLMYFRRKLGILVKGIGPVSLSGKNRLTATVTESIISAEQCIQWLDKMEAKSVIYISFGTQNTITATQMMNLAKALDSSNKHFIWVIRPPLGFDTEAEFVPEQWLPEGFMQDIQEKGMIVKNWAPQLEILAHESIGAFISHCGWNSILEALQNGVPVLGWAMAAEQFYNAKYLVEELGVCVEVARGTSFEVRWEDIVEKIELVMGESAKGKEMRRRVNEIKVLVNDAMRDEGKECKGSSVRALEDMFVEALLKEKILGGTNEIGRSN